MNTTQPTEFKEGQVWLSPKGFAYLVTGITPKNTVGPQIAHIRLGVDGMGRIYHRRVDATINWRLYQEAEEP